MPASAVGFDWDIDCETCKPRPPTTARQGKTIMTPINRSFLRATLFSLSMFCGSAVLAQNLVPNPGFEYHTRCPDNVTELALAFPWFKPTDTTPDYYNACAGNSNAGVPKNLFGFQTAHGGQAYAGAVMFEAGWREYVEVPLLSPLVEYHTYSISFYVSLATNYPHCAIDDVGAYLSVNKLTQAGDGFISRTPQVRNPPGNFLNSSDWTLIQGTYTAVGGEKYLTIGDFDSDANTPYDPASGKFGAFAYYYIDDVSVVDISSCSNNGCITITSPNDIVVSTCSNSLPVNFDVEVVDNCCSNNNYTLTTTPPSGFNFPLGTTTVTNTVTDSCGNSNSCSFTVTVTQNTNPPILLSYPPDVSICISSNGCGLMPDATPEVAALTISGDAATVTQSIPPGTEICSDTNVTFTIFDDCGDTTNCTVPCILTQCCLNIECPTDIVVTTCSNCTPVNFSVGFNDSCCSNCVTVTSSPPSGTCFPLGISMVTNVATDILGDTDTCAFAVLVIQDTSPPTILSFPTNIAICKCSAMPDVTSQVQAITSSGGSANVSQSILPGTLICSATNVTFTITDDCGDATNLTIPVVVTNCGITAYAELKSNNTKVTVTWLAPPEPFTYEVMQTSTNLLVWHDYYDPTNLVIISNGPYILGRSLTITNAGVTHGQFFRLMSTNGGGG